MRTVRAAFLTCFLLLAGQALAVGQAAPAAQGNPGSNQAMFIHIDHGRLTVKLWQAPLEAVLEEIGSRTGIEIDIWGSLTQNVSMEFADFPLYKGLRRLLRDYGWILVSAGDGSTLEKVFVVPTGEGVRLGRRQVGARPETVTSLDRLQGEQLSKDGQETRASPSDQAAHMVTSMLNRKEVKRLFDMFLHNPDQIPQLDAFTNAADAVSKEEVNHLIRMLRDETIEPSEWQAVLAPLSGVMNPKQWESTLVNVQNRYQRENAADMLETVLRYKGLVGGAGAR